MKKKIIYITYINIIIYNLFYIHNNVYYIYNIIYKILIYIIFLNIPLFITKEQKKYILKCKMKNK